jgi:hypothetical protein
VYPQVINMAGCWRDCAPQVVSNRSMGDGMFEMKGQEEAGATMDEGGKMPTFTNALS